MKQTDIFIIGGGINGTAIAADAAGRGLSVVVCEKGDLASGTSSTSTKLIHGGLRYLEHYEFGLVRHALREREILLRRAAHLITPLEFVLPHEQHLRPAWMIRAGLFLYDHLAQRKKIPSSRAIDLTTDERGKALKNGFSKGFAYYDCQTDDARLTVLNALAAKNNHAKIFTQHEFISAVRKSHSWQIKFKNLATQEITEYVAKVLINAAGPWINQVQKKIAEKTFKIKLVKGSHIVIPKMYAGDYAYLLQNKDGRVIFTIPYHDKFTLIGTTDTAIQDRFEQAVISDEETNYLCTVVNQYFKQSITPEKIIWSYSGVRCLQADSTDNLSKLSREHKIDMQIENGLPLVTIIGGKLTTHRTLAEDTVNQLEKYFPHMSPAWTAKKPLPGGDFAKHNFKKFYLQFLQDFSWLPENLAQHYAKNYGTLAYLFLQDCHTLDDLGVRFTALLYQKEVEYLVQHEWAKMAEDILWRRTKLGLFTNAAEQQQLSVWLSQRTPVQM